MDHKTNQFYINSFTSQYFDGFLEARNRIKINYED